MWSIDDATTAVSRTRAASASGGPIAATVSASAGEISSPASRSTRLPAISGLLNGSRPLSQAAGTPPGLAEAGKQRRGSDGAPEASDFEAPLPHRRSPDCAADVVRILRLPPPASAFG